MEGAVMSVSAAGGSDRKGGKGFAGVGLITASLALSACAGRGGPVPYNVQEFGEPDVAVEALPESQQRVSAQDKLKISVFQEPELTGEYEVSEAGKIQFPLIGEVEVQGMLLPEVASAIAQRLGQ